MLTTDIRYAVRCLRRSPGFTAAAILTLAFGIGANTAIFSTIDEALYRPLDFPHPEQLADVFSFNKASQTFLSTSSPDYEDLRARTQTFQRLSAFVRMPLIVSWGERNERLPVEAVTGNFFSMLELPPAAGRVFRDDDDSIARGRVAMLSDEIADPGFIGRTIMIEDEPFTVIGLVPGRYHGTNLNWGDPPRAWIPLQATAIVRPRFLTLDLFHQRAMQWLVVTGRLKPGVTPERAQAEVQTIAAGIAQRFPATNRDVVATVFSAGRAKFWPAYRTSITRSLMVFAVAAGLVLLLTCANISNLLLSRAVARRREFSIRVSLGATRGRLVRQLMTESLLLALPGCAAALAIAYGLSRILAHFPNALGLPLALDGGIEIRMLCFCIALSIGATVLFGLGPALYTTRANPVSGGTHDWLRNSLLVLEIAFTVVLLVGGGLFGRSVLRAWSIEPGFRVDGLLTAGFSAPPPGAASADKLERAQATLLTRLRGMPGVQSATVASSPPLNPLHFRTQLQAVTADRHTVGADFFRTLGISLLNGREFNRRDDRGSPKVAIVNEALAARLWPDASPVGQNVLMGKTSLQVIGVARDSKYESVWEERQPYLYVADSQSTGPASFLIVRAAGTPRNLAARINDEWTRILPRSPLYDFRTGGDLMDIALAPQRIAVWVFGAFGLLSVALASVGIYSLMSYAVARRTREIGIRIAIGAGPSVVVRQILGRSMTVAGAGMAAGLVLSALLVKNIETQVKGVSIYDLAVFASVAALLAIIAVLAGCLPARRAARLDPQQALRAE